MVDKITRFEVSINEIEKINPLFSKAKVRVLYTGLNRNNTHFSKSVVESALPSIFNIPIVGEYLEEKENFGGHGGKIEITDRGIEYVQTTKPYGVVPESATTYWENITEKDGTINEYLVIDGVYLWTGRYDELENLLNQSYGQSMEIEIQDGDISVIDGIRTFDIKKFLFSALCILGVNKNGEGHVEPCFESSSITAYSLDKEEFKKQFNQMIAELKFSLIEQEGGEKMEEKFEQEIVEEVVEFTEENFEAVEEIVETEPVTEEVVEEVETVEETVEEFDYKSEYEKIKGEFELLTENFSKLEEEVKGLRDFKELKTTEERVNNETELFESFSAELNEDEMQPLKETASEFSLEQLEEKLFTLVGKKKANFNKQQKKEKQIVKIEVEHVEEKPKAYGGLFEKYSN